MTDSCVVCGHPLADEEERRARWPWYACGLECGKRFKAQVEALARAAQPRLYAAKDEGRELVLDPYVGDELAIARCSLEMRIGDDLTREWRTARLARSCAELGIPPDLAPALLILADRQAGMNFVDVVVEGRGLHVWQGGGIREEEPAAGYFWERVPGGWQEHRPQGDSYDRRILKDAELRPPKYGDVEGATALSWPEHFGSCR